MSLHLAGHTVARGTSSTAEAPVGHWLSRTSTTRTSGASGRAGPLQCTRVGFETTKTYLAGVAWNGTLGCFGASRNN